ncbi:MAG: hypothetical protein WCQ59_09570, partial [Candidatus Cloacimonadaceae bacterium]
MTAPFFSHHTQKLQVAIIDSLFDRTSSACRAARLYNIVARFFYRANPTAFGISPNVKVTVF